MRRRKRGTRRPDDPVRAFQAWQDHQYDPGYWRLLPLRQIRKPMPRIGYVFISTGILFGLVTLIGTIVALNQHANPLGLVVIGGFFTALQLLMGRRFLGLRRHQHPRSHRRK